MQIFKTRYFESNLEINKVKLVCEIQNINELMNVSGTFQFVSICQVIKAQWI